MHRAVTHLRRTCDKLHGASAADCRWPTPGRCGCYKASLSIFTSAEATERALLGRCTVSGPQARDLPQLHDEQGALWLEPPGNQCPCPRTCMPQAVRLPSHHREWGHLCVMHSGLCLVPTAYS